MKLKVLISLFFIITTTFASIHEVQHIQHADDNSCLVCHVSDNLTSADITDKTQDIKKFHFEEVLDNKSLLSYHAKNHSNQNRAPPLTS